jgi:hypothetical protein
VKEVMISTIAAVQRISENKLLRIFILYFPGFTMGVTVIPTMDKVSTF